jgi:hypothetical protein
MAGHSPQLNPGVVPGTCVRIVLGFTRNGNNDPPKSQSWQSRGFGSDRRHLGLLITRPDLNCSPRLVQKSFNTVLILDGAALLTIGEGSGICPGIGGTYSKGVPGTGTGAVTNLIVKPLETLRWQRSQKTHGAGGRFSPAPFFVPMVFALLGIRVRLQHSQ